MVEVSQGTRVDDQDLDEVDIAKDQLASLSADDDSYFSKLGDLAHKLVSRFSRSGNLDDLDEGISRWKQVLNLSPPGHSFHLQSLSNVGGALNTRFNFSGDANDLSQAIGYFEASVKACTPDQSLYLALVANLARGLLARYRSYGDVKDLDQIVETGSSALSTSPAESPNRDVLLVNLANAFKERFEKLSKRSDLDTALVHYKSALNLRPPGHPSRHIVLGNLADAILYRYEMDGRPEDLETAANHFVSALQLRTPGQSGYLFYLRSLGVVYWRLFNAQGNTDTLETAIGCFETAMTHSKVLDLDHSRLLDNFGTALQSRYVFLGNKGDLDRAIQYLTTSSNIQPMTYSGRPITLLQLATALYNRFNETGESTDLDTSIHNLASALELCGPGYQHRPVMLSVYGRALSSRFFAKGDLDDLRLAASLCKEALALSSPTELTYPTTVANLTTVLLDYFHRFGDIKECQIVIEHCDRALVSTPPSELAFMTLKINRAKAFQQKYLFEREEASIHTAIDAFRELIPMLHEDHAEYVPVHLQFGIALETRFQFNANVKDIDESIALFRAALRHCKPGSTNYVPVCMQLGSALRESFESDNSPVEALDEAIVLLTKVEELMSRTPENIDYKTSLVDLGVALFMRFQTRRNSADLDDAVERVSHALALPASAEDFQASFCLATLLSARYGEYEKLEDLERSVELFGVAAEQMPPKHVFRGMLCRNYGHVLFKLGNHHRDRLQQIDAALVFYTEALEHIPPSHFDLPISHMRLAEASYERAKLLCDQDGMLNAIETCRSIVQTVPSDSPMIYAVSQAAAKLFTSAYGDSGRKFPSLMEEAFGYFKQAARYTQTRSYQSVFVGLEWASLAEQLGHSSALQAYQTSLSSLNQHLLGTASVKSRRAALLDKNWIRKSATLATDATACAIAQGQLKLAVELSENGRGLLWSQLSQSRTPLDALRSGSETGRALASEFERVSTLIARRTVDVPSSIAPSRFTTEEAARGYRQLSKELDHIIAQIRQQDGFESFLESPSYEGLNQAAVGGPVILVNVSQQRCDALIVLHDIPPRLVPLPNATLEDLTALSTQLYHSLKTTMRVGDEKRREREVSVVLRTLWDCVVHPIVEDLTPILPRGSRIWWCPTSKLASLPLHAAGPYRKGAPNLANLYISSYTPTLAALMRARQHPSPSAVSPSPQSFLAVGQSAPASSSSPQLQTVSAELELVRSLVPGSMPFHALSDEASTAEAVLGALATHGWAHMACHGNPHVEEPFDSAFELRDRAVTVLDVVRARGVRASVRWDTDADGKGDADNVDAGSTLPPGEFAFLSACHTAVGDPRAPDEIISLAAAVQFAGFRSVIGTMWAVDDLMAVEMVRAFYTQMFPRVEGGDGNGEQGWDATQAARALNRACKAVGKEVSIDQRVVFIHIGA